MPPDWNERFAGDAYFYGDQPNDFLASVADRLPPGPTLMLADGEGRNGVFLAERGQEVTSVDLSEAGLAKTRRLAAERGVSVTTVHADLAEYAITPESWDIVVSIFAHLPSEVRRPLHERVIRGLRPGGLFVLEAYTPDQIGRGTGGPPSADMMPTLEGLRVELAGLDFEHALECERSVVEGEGHTGDARVVQVVGRKPVS